MEANEIVTELRNNELSAAFFMSTFAIVVREAANTIESQQALIEQLTKELDAAKADLKISAYCRTCANRCGLTKSLSKRSNSGSCQEYEWRGLTEDIK